MDRVLQATGSTATVTFYEDGVIVDPGTVTVTVDRADGTNIVTAAATGGSGANARTYNITAANTTLLDILKLTWLSATKGQLVTRVEIVGGFYFTLADMRAIRGLGDTTDYPTSALLDMRTTVEDAIEEYTGALVPRYAYETTSAVRCQPIRLRKPYLRVIRSVKVAGTALSVDQLAALTVTASMVNGYGWSTGFNNVTVGYEHGLDQPPQRLRRAALLLAKVWLLAGPVDDRTSTFTSTEGGTYSLVTPGRGGSMFGVPEVDAAVMDHRIPVVA